MIARRDRIEMGGFRFGVARKCEGCGTARDVVFIPESGESLCRRCRTAKQQQLEQRKDGAKC
jgi:hypothetical protein